MGFEEKEYCDYLFREFFDNNVRHQYLGEATKKIIFLDVVGVLTDDTGFHIDEAKVKRLKKIIDETGAYVVLSSTIGKTYMAYTENVDEIEESRRKNMVELQDIFNKYGINILDCTMDVGDEVEVARPYEIKVWLMKRTDVGSFVILDGKPWVWKWLKYRVVKTIKKDPENESASILGLEDEHVQPAIEMLNNVPEQERY